MRRRTNEDQRRLVLGLPSRPGCRRWMGTAREHRSLAARGGYALTRTLAVLGIHGALSILFASQEKATGWLTSPHRAPVFGRQPSIEFVFCGTLDGLLNIQRFPDASGCSEHMPSDEVDFGFHGYHNLDIVLP